MSSRQAFTRLSLAVVVALPFGTGAFAARAAGAATVPSAPRAVSAIQHGNGGAQVSWQAPATNGGSQYSSFVVTPYKAGVAQPAVTFHSRKLTQTLTGLQNKVSYRFTVAAGNAVGTGAASAKSNAIIVGAPGIPNIEGRKIVTRHRLQVFVYTGNHGMGPPGNGAVLTGLNATCTSSNGGASGSGHGKISSGYNLSWVYVSGLTHGKSYTCTVTATNSRGTGLPSQPSSPITM